MNNTKKYRKTIEWKKGHFLNDFRGHFKKIGDTKETFHARMGTVRDRKSMNLTEAEEIKKTWQENTEELKKERS